MTDRHRLHWILDERGEPAVARDLYHWADWLQTGNRVIGRELIGDIRVSTVFLGWDYRVFGEGPPILFETMIFGGRYDQYQERYCTRSEAVAGHERALYMVRETAGEGTADGRGVSTGTTGKAAEGEGSV